MDEKGKNMDGNGRKQTGAERRTRTGTDRKGRKPAETDGNKRKRTGLTKENGQEGRRRMGTEGKHDRPRRKVEAPAVWGEIATLLRLSPKMSPRSTLGNGSP